MTTLKLIKFFRCIQWVGSLDRTPNDDANESAVVESCDSWVDQEQRLCEKVDAMLAGSKLDAIVCVAGGWAGGNAASKGRRI